MTLLAEVKQGSIISFLEDDIKHLPITRCCNNLYVTVDPSSTVSLSRRFRARVYCYICHKAYDYYYTRSVKIVHTISI